MTTPEKQRTTSDSPSKESDSPKSADGSAQSTSYLSSLSSPFSSKKRPVAADGGGSSSVFSGFAKSLFATTEPKKTAELSFEQTVQAELDNAHKEQTAIRDFLKMPLKGMPELKQGLHAAGTPTTLDILAILNADVSNFKTFNEKELSKSNATQSFRVIPELGAFQRGIKTGGNSGLKLLIAVKRVQRLQKLLELFQRYYTLHYQLIRYQDVFKTKQLIDPNALKNLPSQFKALKTDIASFGASLDIILKQEISALTVKAKRNPRTLESLVESPDSIHSAEERKDAAAKDFPRLGWLEAINIQFQVALEPSLDAKLFDVVQQGVQGKANYTTHYDQLADGLNKLAKGKMTAVLEEVRSLNEVFVREQVDLEALHADAQKLVQDNQARFDECQKDFLNLPLLIELVDLKFNENLLSSDLPDISVLLNYLDRLMLLSRQPLDFLKRHYDLDGEINPAQQIKDAQEALAKKSKSLIDDLSQREEAYSKQLTSYQGGISEAMVLSLNELIKKAQGYQVLLDQLEKAQDYEALLDQQNDPMITDAKTQLASVVTNLKSSYAQAVRAHSESVFLNALFSPSAINAEGANPMLDSAAKAWLRSLSALQQRGSEEQDQSSTENTASPTLGADALESDEKALVFDLNLSSKQLLGMLSSDVYTSHPRELVQLSLSYAKQASELDVFTPALSEEFFQAIGNFATRYQCGMDSAITEAKSVVAEKQQVVKRRLANELQQKAAEVILALKADFEQSKLSNSDAQALVADLKNKLIQANDLIAKHMKSYDASWKLLARSGSSASTGRQIVVSFYQTKIELVLNVLDCAALKDQDEEGFKVIQGLIVQIFSDKPIPDEVSKQLARLVNEAERNRIEKEAHDKREAFEKEYPVRKAAIQQGDYPDRAELDQAVAELASDCQRYEEPFDSDAFVKNIISNKLLPAVESAEASLQAFELAVESMSHHPISEAVLSSVAELSRDADQHLSQLNELEQTWWGPSTPKYSAMHDRFKLMHTTFQKSREKLNQVEFAEKQAVDALKTIKTKVDDNWSGERYRLFSCFARRDEHDGPAHIVKLREDLQGLDELVGNTSSEEARTVMVTLEGSVQRTDNILAMLALVIQTLNDTQPDRNEEDTAASVSCFGGLFAMFARCFLGSSLCRSHRTQVTYNELHEQAKTARTNLFEASSSQVSRVPDDSHEAPSQSGVSHLDAATL